jgi:hypothetical protein
MCGGIQKRPDIQTTTGVTCATLPTSSSACMMRLMRATGKWFLMTMSSALGGSIEALGIVMAGPGADAEANASGA